jgi:hypothetical protein
MTVFCAADSIAITSFKAATDSLKTELRCFPQVLVINEINLPL